MKYNSQQYITKADHVHGLLIQRLASFSNTRRLKIKQKIELFLFENGFAVKEKRLQSFYIPHFYDLKQYQTLAEHLDHLYSSLLKAEHYFYKKHDKKLYELVYSHLPKYKRYFIELMIREPLYSQKRRLSRVDGFAFSKDLSEFKVIEMNSMAPALQWYSHLLHQATLLLLQEVNLIHLVPHSPDRVDYLLDWLIGEYQSRKGSRKAPKGIALVCDTGFNDTRQDEVELCRLASAMRKRLVERGYTRINVLWGTPVDFKLQSGQMHLHGVPIDVVWKNNIMIDLFSVCGGPLPLNKEFHNALSRPDKYAIVNGERSCFTGMKSWMALLTNEFWQKRFKLSNQEKESLHHLLPRAFVVGEMTKSDQSYCVKHKDEFVIKDSYSFCANSVKFGAKTTTKNWKELLKNGNNGRLVQEYLPYRKAVTDVQTINERGHLITEKRYYDICPHKIGEHFVPQIVSRTIPISGANGQFVPLNVAAGGGLLSTLVI